MFCSLKHIHAKSFHAGVLSYSGAPPPAEPHNHKGKRNPCIDFLMVIMGSGNARGCVRTTTESRMAAILQIIGLQRQAALVYRVIL